MIFKYKLNEKVKDKLTGFEGTVVARCEFVNGCTQYELQSSTLKDGLPQKTMWIDEVQLVEKVETKTVYRPYPVMRGLTGGPARVPAKRTGPI